MLEIGEEFDLPPDAKDLTRELALKCCAHPEVLWEAFARIALEQAKSTPDAAAVPEGTRNGR